MGRSALASGELGQHNGLRWTIIVSTDLLTGDSQAGSDTAPRVGVRRRWPVLSHRPSARHPRSRRSHRPLPHRCNPKHPISTRLRHHLTAQPTPTQRPMPMPLIQHAVMTGMLTGWPLHWHCRKTSRAIASTASPARTAIARRHHQVDLTAASHLHPPTARCAVLPQLVLQP